MKIPTQRLLLMAACALLATVVASDGVGHGTSRRSRLKYIMNHRTGCGGGLVVSSPQKHEKKEPVILSYSPDRTERVQAVSLQTGASSPFGMPETAARKAEEAANRRCAMELLYDYLEASRLTLAKETWEKCNLMLGEAYRRQDRVGLERLRLLKKRILGSLDEAEREAMLRLMPPADRPPSRK